MAEIGIVLLVLLAILLPLWLLAVVIVFKVIPPRTRFNWRMLSPYHVLSSGPNSYYSWLDKHQPD